MATTVTHSHVTEGRTRGLILSECHVGAAGRNSFHRRISHVKSHVPWLVTVLLMPGRLVSSRLFTIALAGRETTDI